MPVGWLFDGIFDWLGERVLDALDWLVDFLTSAFFTSPDVTVLPQVQALAQRSAMIVQTTFGLLIIVAAMIGMTHGSVQIRYELKDLLPRLVFAFIASGFALPLCAGLIEVANALTTAMVGDVASGPRVVRFVGQQVRAALLDKSTAAISLILGLLIVILFFQLLFGWIVRVTTLLVLAGTAPIAFACYGLPHTQAVAQLWWRSLLGSLGIPMLQGIAFAAVIDLVVDPDHALPVLLGLPPSHLMNLIIVTCLLVVTVRIPKLVARYAATRGGSTSPVGVVIRAVAVQTVGRNLPIAGVRRMMR
jgi:hypothetical protein